MMVSSPVTDPASAEAALKQALRLSRSGLPQLGYYHAVAVREWARAGHDAGDRDALLAAASAQLAWCCFMMAAYELGVSFGQDAKEVWQRRGEQALQARTCAVLAWNLASIGDPEAASEARAALGLAERSGDVDEAIWALNTNGLVLWMLRQPDRALPFGQEAVALGRKRGAVETTSLINLAGIEVELGLIAARVSGSSIRPEVVDRGISLTREALLQARSGGDGWQERLALCNIAEYEIAAGRFDAAEQTLMHYASAAGEPTDRCRAHYLHMRGRTELGQATLGRIQADAAIVTLSASRDIAMRCNDLESATGIYRDLAEAYSMQGDHERALESFKAFHDAYVRQASETAQRRARSYALQWESDQLRALASEARQRVEELAAANQLLAEESERLMRASLEDPLTGLQNRRRLDLAFIDLQETGAHFILVMIDVDNFKRVNDRFSHPVGDSVLREIAVLLRQGCGADDLVVRFGGEEFSILMPSTNPMLASATCERLRHTIEHHEWSRVHPALSLTVSIGLACSAEASTHGSVLALADYRLYAAKRGGRNRVVAEGGSQAGEDARPDAVTWPDRQLLDARHTG